MPQHPPAQDDTVHDETVRMRADGPTGRPSPDATRSAPEDAADDTRPVTRNWLLGAPDAGTRAPAVESTGSPATAGTGAVPPAERPVDAEDATPTAESDDDWTTQALDLSAPPPETGAPAGTLVAATTVEEPATPAPVAPTSADARADTPAGPPPGGPPPTAGRTRPWWQRRRVLVPAGAFAVLAATYGLDVVASAGDVPRHTVVAGVDIGGLSSANAARTLEEELAPRLAAEHSVVADDVEAAVSPVAAGLALDVDATVDAADDQPLNPWTRLVTLFGDREIEPVITADDTALGAQIETVASNVDRAPVDATIAIDGTTPSVAEPLDGRHLDRDGAADAILAAFRSGQDPATPIELPVEVSAVRVDEAEAQRVLDETVTPALSAPVSIVGAPGGPSAEVPPSAIASSLTFTPQENGELAVGIDPAALQTALGEELEAFGSGAKDARFEVSGGAVTVVPSVDGVGIDPAHLAEQLLPVLSQEAPRSVDAELGPVPADFTTEEAQALGIKEEIGSFTTNIGNPNSGENIRVVAAEVDGAVVLPGETFSLNTFTGPRGTAQGYVAAGVISGGQFTQAVGGGISQFATTMFNAVFFSGLEDVYHKPHSYYISRYPAGREATVYEGQIDLQWRNDSDTGVYIDTAWTPGTITVTFYGTKRYEIQSLSGDRVNVRQPALQEKPDDGTCKPQSGNPGFDITVTRVFRDLVTGAEIRRESFNTHYAAEPTIRCIPAAAPPAPPPATPGG
ncbi:MAG: putative vancomycin resistance protein [Blastococcus sp.]|nr:putative vancomycin resistance protein [Blastococcus sp.]